MEPFQEISGLGPIMEFCQDFQSEPNFLIIPLLPIKTATILPDWVELGFTFIGILEKKKRQPGIYTPDSEPPILFTKTLMTTERPPALDLTSASGLASADILATILAFILSYWPQGIILINSNTGMAKPSKPITTIISKWVWVE